MSYFNQPDHELLDRRDDAARRLLSRLAQGKLAGLEAPLSRLTEAKSHETPAGGGPTSAWLAYARTCDIPAPDSEPLTIDGQIASLVWRSHYVAALLENNSALVSKLEDKGFAVVVLGHTEVSWPETTSSLAKLLGRHG